MTGQEVWRRIQAFDLPGRVKRELMALWHSAKRLVEAIVRFMAAHKHFSHCLLLGAIMCFVLCTLPVAIAQYLGLMALVTCAAIGLAQDLKDSLGREIGTLKV